MAIIESEQTRNTELTQYLRGPFRLRFASYRKREDTDSEVRSEDYLVTDILPERALFALCDGVGSSFYGNLASQFLAETLMNWLRNQFTALTSESTPGSATVLLDKLKASLLQELDRRSNLADSVVRNKKLESRDPLVRSAEESQREEFGSQSNFVCGLLLPKSAKYPDGLVSLFWLGNARLRLFQKREHDYEDLTQRSGWGQNPAQLKEAWSSKEGVVGQIYTYCTDFSQISHILVYSDGLEEVNDQIVPNFDAISFKLLADRAQSIKDDDISFLELTFTQQRIAQHPDEIVALVRNHYAVTTAPADHSDGTRKLATLQNELGSLKKRNAGLKRQAAWLAIALSFLFLSCGVLTGWSLHAVQVIRRTPTPTKLSSPTALVLTYTPIASTETPIPTASPVTVEPNPATTTQIPLPINTTIVDTVSESQLIAPTVTSYP